MVLIRKDSFMNPIVKHFIKEGEQFLHELLDTKHYGEISKAAEYMSKFDNNQNCSELRKAIELLKKVNEEDRKDARCKAFEDIALCYYKLSTKCCEKKNFVEAIDYIDESIRYQCMILQLDETVFTRNCNKISSAKKNTPLMIEQFLNKKQEIKRNMPCGGGGVNWKTVTLSATVALVVAAVALLIAFLI